MDVTVFPTHKGTYILLLRLDDVTNLTIGKLGTFDFDVGWYIYVGSAFGSGGLRGRLKHHLTPVMKAHWHIDYLRSHAPVHKVWYLADDTRYEHQWATSLSQMPQVGIPIPRFGASDCTCAAHLFYSKNQPNFARFCATVGLDLTQWTA